jgi:hypothetical protein
MFSWGEYVLLRYVRGPIFADHDPEDFSYGFWGYYANSPCASWCSWCGEFTISVNVSAATYSKRRGEARA